MITVEQLYAGTREGLDIILSVYPQAEVCVSNPKAKFKARESERTPSAMLMATTDKNGNRVWKMIDYGDEGHALSPVDVWMKERGINRFGEAVLHSFHKRFRLFCVRFEEYDTRPVVVILHAFHLKFLLYRGKESSCPNCPKGAFKFVGMSRSR